MFDEGRQILRAAALAREAHEGQFRKWSHSGDPYVWHPMRVAGLVSMVEGATPAMVQAAWLHDVLEDTKAGEEAFFAGGFGGEVLSIVKGVTNPSIGTGLSRCERKAMDRRHVAGSCWASRALKLADRLDNVVEMRNDPMTPKDFVEMYKGETRLLLDALKGTDAKLEAMLERMVGR